MSDPLSEPVKDEQDAAQRVIEVIGATPKKIKSEEEYNAGMTWLGSVRIRRKRVEEFFESLKAPIRKALKVVKDKEDGILAPLEVEERKLKQLTGDYFMEQRRIAEEKQRKENEKHQEKVDRAIETGKDPANVAPPKVIETLQTTVKSEAGPTVSMRLVKNWRVKAAPKFCQQYEGKIFRADSPALADIPDVCWELNTARTAAAAKSGMCSALELYEVPSQAVSG